MRDIRLTQAHEHAGRQYPPGSTLTLTDADAAWLIALGRAEPVETGRKTKPTKNEESGQ